MYSVPKTKSLLTLLSFGLVASLVGGGPALSSFLSAQNRLSEIPLYEQALRTRIEQFYGLMRLGRYEDGEAFITPDTRENFRAQGKNAIMDFQIVDLKFDPAALSSPKKADLTIRVSVFVPPATQPIPSQLSNTWVLENGVWMMQAPKVKVVTAQGLFNNRSGLQHPPAPPLPQEFKFEKTTASFGKADRGSKPIVRFPFKNIADHPVSIEVSTFCECLVPQGVKKEYKPGESGFLTIEFDTGDDFFDEYSQTIIVKTLPGGAETRLLITGYIPRFSGKHANDPPGSDF